jgi:hypothetical protein
MTLRPIAPLGLGLVTGVLVALTIAACCPEVKDVVWDASPGTYTPFERLGPAPLHGDTNYQSVISDDGNSAVETYERGGEAFRIEYVIGPGTESPLRSDDNLGVESPNGTP